MQFEVPQFIDIEDKIFGPFTWRQFLYLGGGVGMGVVLFFTTYFIVFLFLGLPLALLAIALAFYPVNNRPFSHFLEAIFNYVRGKKLYLWRQHREIVYRDQFIPHNTSALKRVDPLQTAPTRKTQSVTSLSRRLELEAIQIK